MRGLPVVLFACAVAIVACHSAPSAAPTPATTPRVMTRVVVSDGFVPDRGDSAIRAFVADVPPFDSGGECAFVRTSGSGSTLVTAFFPNRTSAKMQATLAFDSAGRLIRYTEIHGVVRFRLPPGTTDAQRDSVLRAATTAVRSTMVTLDYALDQGILSNRGGGKPSHAVLGSVRAVENLESAGRPRERMERVRKLCGV